MKKSRVNGVVEERGYGKKKGLAEGRCPKGKSKRLKPLELRERGWEGVCGVKKNQEKKSHT